MTFGDAALLVCMALCVYGPKVVPLAFVTSRRTQALRTWLEYVSPAVLSALVAAEIAAPGGSLATPRMEHLSYLAVLFVGVATRRVWASLIAGLAVYFLIRAFS
jgi:branched-subunit amino acid transport protein